LPNLRRTSEFKAVPVENTLKEEESALDYEYDPAYKYGDVEFDAQNPWHANDFSDDGDGEYSWQLERDPRLVGNFE